MESLLSGPESLAGRFGEEKISPVCNLRVWNSVFVRECIVAGSCRQLYDLTAVAVGVPSVTFSVAMLVAADLYLSPTADSASHDPARLSSPLLSNGQSVPIRQTTEAELCASEHEITCILRLRGVVGCVGCVGTVAAG
jgi:hypothetical protein